MREGGGESGSEPGGLHGAITVPITAPAASDSRAAEDARAPGRLPWTQPAGRSGGGPRLTSHKSLPNHEAARFLGHSPLIAAAHYLQPSDHKFRAVASEGPWITAQTAAERGVLDDAAGFRADEHRDEAG